MMYKLIAALFLISSLLSEISFAQLGATENYCERCRDPYEHPDDYVNYAYDQIYGDDGWMDFDQADDFYISNPDGFVVYVDVDFVMHGLDFLGTSLPLWPTYFLQIAVVLPNGNIYTTQRSVFHRTLPVPTSQDPAPAGPTEGGDGGDEGVDDPEDDDEEWEPPEIERNGRVEIEDPDENGEFADTEWCQEC
jgi:hypothetical protein